MSLGNSTAPRMTKETVSFIGKLAEKDSKRKKKKETKKPEDGIVRCLAKQGLVDKTKAKAARKSTSKKKKKKKKGCGSSSSSSSYSDSSSSSRSNSSSDSDDSSSDYRATTGRGSRRIRSPKRATTTIHLLPKLRAKQEKKRRYRSSLNLSKMPKRECSTMS